MIPTESVVIANIANIMYVRALIAAMFERAAGEVGLPHERTSPRCIDHAIHRFQIHVEPRPVRIVSPLDGNLMIAARQQMKLTGERRMRVAEADQLEKLSHNGTLDFHFDLLNCVMVSIDVAAFSGPAQQFHVVGARQQSHVVDLRHSGRENCRARAIRYSAS